MSKKKQDKVKRTLNLVGLDKQIELNKVTRIHLDKGDKEFIYIEKLKSGDWLFAYTSNTIEDINKLEAIEIIQGLKIERCQRCKKPLTLAESKKYKMCAGCIIGSCLACGEALKTAECTICDKCLTERNNEKTQKSI